jgi:hypothetical protein
MPYGRRYKFRRRRRSRPSAGRAVPRTTLAPRHQYLKLRATYAIDFAQSSLVDDHHSVQFALQMPYSSLWSASYTTVNPYSVFLRGSDAPLGWTSYQSLFSQYCVHGVKVVTKFQCQHADTCMYSIVEPDAVSTTRNSAPDHPYAPANLSRPGTKVTVGNQSQNWTDKRYINLNRLFGLSVKKHDAFIHGWKDAGSSDYSYDLRKGLYQIGFFRINPQKNDGLSFGNATVTLVYYLSAVNVRAEFLTTTEAAAVKAVSNPLTEDLGSPSTATATNYQSMQTTGFAQTSADVAALNAMNTI